jgi:hypothetical protein
VDVPSSALAFRNSVRFHRECGDCVPFDTEQCLRRSYLRARATTVASTKGKP